MKRKIGFYLYNIGIDMVDFSDPLDGNPGVGGSEYLTVLTAWQLAVRVNGLEVTLFAEKEGKFPKGLNVVLIDGSCDAIQKAEEGSYDIFVIDSKRLDWNQVSILRLKGKMRLVPWCHNFISPRMAKIWAQFPLVSRVVSVGREQMDLYRDDRVFLKSDYIYNAVPLKKEYVEKAECVPYNQRPHSVAYLGSILRNKSFHVLASIWNKILEEVPDAELYVIGSGKVYSQNSKLGKYNIADEDYESEFMPYLTDSNGAVLPSVHFLGAMGEEKYDVLKNVRVGCPNPTGNSETFCLSAVEMQAMGCAVAAMESPGYYDTFYNGKISKNKEELIRDIVSLLKSGPVKSYDDTLSYIESNFSVDKVIKDWETLLSGDMVDYLHPIYPLVHPNYRHKRTKEAIRRIKHILPFLYSFPYMDRFFSKFRGL